MEQFAVIALDLIAVGVLVFGLYFPRHRRRDLVAAYLGVNVGVLAVSEVLSQSTISFGVGMGLFGVLSIIRLRSYEIEQHEIAYYFSALAIGLLAGLTPLPTVFTAVLLGLILVVMWAGDHPRLFRRYRAQTVIVDHVYGSEAELRAHLERLLGGEVHTLIVKRLDLTKGTSTVQVTWAVPQEPLPLPPADPEPATASTRPSTPQES